MFFPEVFEERHDLRCKQESTSSGEVGIGGGKEEAPPPSGSRSVPGLSSVRPPDHERVVCGLGLITRSSTSQLIHRRSVAAGATIDTLNGCLTRYFG